MLKLRRLAFSVTAVLSLAALGTSTRAEGPIPAMTSWAQCGWGGGGFYYSAAFHPTRDGVIYMGGDVNGMYKSTDHGKNWKIINNGIADYGVFSIAVDRKAPDTVYAATAGGLCKSTDAGEHWAVLPKTGKKDLRITGEKGKSIRCIALDPSDSNVVYAASPAGKVFKSTDGGQTWNLSYEKPKPADDIDAMRVQFGKNNAEYFGGFWTALAFPKDVKNEDCVGFGFSFKGDKSAPRDCYINLKTTTGAAFKSRNLNELFKDDAWRDIVLTAKDFVVDPDYAKKNPEKAAALTAGPDWSTVNRMDLAVVGSLPQEAYAGKFSKIFFALTRTADGKTGTPEKPILAIVKELSSTKTALTYGNIRIGNPSGGSILYVAVAPKEPSLVIAATAGTGLILSNDAGASWRPLSTPQQASSIAFAETDTNTVYASFFKDGIWKSTDKGATWANVTNNIDKNFAVKEVAVSPANAQDVYAIGAIGWGGAFFYSNDGGKTWKKSGNMKADDEGSPTLPAEPKNAPMSTTTNLAINPNNPKEMYISANWRSCYSDDAGVTWTERNRGADISCIYDIRFQNGRTYASAMDEGVLVSDNNGEQWKQLWPLKWSPEISGHFWRLAISDANGKDRIVSTCSPWEAKHSNRIVLSEDGGKTFKIVTEGLPDYTPHANTMWGQGYARAMAADPADPKIIYMGIDGDPTPDKSGGGLFKSEDGGLTWKQLPNQPASRRMFLGLAVDPKDSKRLYWAACGNEGGLHRSEDGGETWQKVFSTESWIFNVYVAADGTVYCPGKNLWRSSDHGKTWKQLTKFAANRAIVGIETHPSDPKTIWISATTWDGSSDGAIYKTTDSGATWQDITGDIPYRKPLILRFNKDTNELWAGGVGLYKVKQ